jgi:hypothetical protein
MVWPVNVGKPMVWAAPAGVLPDTATIPAARTAVRMMDRGRRIVELQ